MFIIVGGAGHIGSATAGALLEHGQPVTVVTREAAHGEAWRKRGAGIAACDVRDVKALRAVFRRGRRAFLLNPPARRGGGDPARGVGAQLQEPGLLRGRRAVLCVHDPRDRVRPGFAAAVFRHPRQRFLERLCALPRPAKLIAAARIQGRSGNFWVKMINPKLQNSKFPKDFKGFIGDSLLPQGREFHPARAQQRKGPVAARLRLRLYVLTFQKHP